ncbi:Fanconi anemia group M protein isoform X2 [Anoplophora glabripennis]|nr:Fanconi anemia group M protein isoform X2 [Anoplophora glabripennis]
MEKRVFFITPQILQNDLEKLTGLYKKIKCLVFDEAHRARGNHAYCEVIRKLLPHNKYFRVLALSATPGSTVSDVLEVVKNLLISHLEFRTEESLDVSPYVFERNLTTVVVPLGEKLQKIRDDYLKILEYYTGTLIKYKVIQGNCGNLTKGKIFMTLKQFQQNAHNTGSSNYGEIMKSLNICVTLYHGFELLIRHGLRSFLSFFDEHADKPLLKGNMRLIEIMNDIREYLGPEPVIEQLPDGSFVEIPKSSKFGHPKFYKLRDILASHFALENDSGRVIVFFEYRNSVKEAYALLNQARPLLRPRIFVGQAHGITQRQQLSVIKSFKEGECNVLLSTCIGEEGLDVGDVDLIVCFDISSKSPVRMVQRMGRTGRKKEGRIIVLVTEGKEQHILKDCLMHKNNIPLQVLSSKEISKGLSSDSPRLVPLEVQPKCNKIYITIKKVPLSKNSSIKDMFRNISNKSSEPYFPPDLQIVEVQDRIPKPEFLWNKENPVDRNLKISNLFSKKLEKQRVLQPVHLVKHSPSSELLVSLLQRADSKRFNIPLTQIGHSQLSQSKTLKQSDIRSMFLKPQCSSEFGAPTQAQNVGPSPIDYAEEKVSHHSKKLLSEISDYLSIEMSSNNTGCKHCPDNFDCTSFCITPNLEEITWPQIDESVLNITLGDLQTFFKSQIMKSESNTENSPDNDIQQTQNSVVSEVPKKGESSDDSDVELENEICTIPPSEKTFTYQAPKTFDNLLNKYSTSVVEASELPKIEFNEKNKTKQICNSVETNVDNGSTSVLGFFNLNSIKDLLPCVKIADSQETIIYSPDIIENSFVSNVSTNDNELNNQMNQNNVSPVLCTFERARNIKNFHKKLFTSQEGGTDSHKSTVKERNKPNLKKLKLHSSSDLYSRIETPSKFSSDTVKSSSTPLHIQGQEKNSSEALRISNPSGEKHETGEIKGKINQTKIDIEDLCDLSIFGLSTSADLKPTVKEIKNNATNTNPIKSNLCLDDICDLKMFGIGDATISFMQTNGRGSLRNKDSESAEFSEKYKTDFNTNSSRGMQKGSSKHNIVNISKSKKFVGSSHVPSQSQASVTQIIDLINADETITTQKENLEITNRSFKLIVSGNEPRGIKKRRVNPFIENEAELSVDEDVIVSEDEDDEDQNLYEASFINDNTQNLDTQMHVRYLQSTRSPRKRDKFKIPQKPSRFVDVFSQEVPVDDTYLDDSFVVHDEIVEEHQELSELEILEEKLRVQKRKRRKSDGVTENVKRKRIKQLLSDDSD